MTFLSAFWRTVVAVLSIASVGFAICTLFAAWFALSLASSAGGLLDCHHGGRIYGCEFDPGGSYGNALQNYLQLLLLFANLSLTNALGATVASVQARSAEHSKHLEAIRRDVSAMMSSANAPVDRA